MPKTVTGDTGESWSATWAEYCTSQGGLVFMTSLLYVNLPEFSVIKWLYFLNLNAMPYVYLGEIPTSEKKNTHNN